MIKNDIFKNAKGNTIYFENLNAIRFIAASLVVIHHIEQEKDIFKITNWWGNPMINCFGKAGVILFFSLSGFLISFLLLKEEKLTNTISIKKFYIRRILRIWPLYFLIVGLSLFIFPSIPFFSIEGYTKELIQSNLSEKIFLYLFFLPNLVLTTFGLIPYCYQTWSVGAEEQFYLVWPVLNKYIKNKWVLFFGVIVIVISLKKIALFFPIFQPVEKYLYWTPIQAMAIGGIYALIVLSELPYIVFVKKLMFNKIIQIIGYTVLFFLIYKGYFFPNLNNEVYAVLFGFLICNLACNENRLFSMENSVTRYLGKISYGLYMYHLIAIVTAIKFCHLFKFENNFIIYPLTFGILILISSFSYHFFENRFIKRKSKYSVIVSGDDAISKDS